MKYCKDCRWISEASEYSAPWCLVDRPPVEDMVYGMTRIAKMCSDARQDPNDCGPEGKLWEARTDAHTVETKGNT